MKRKVLWPSLFSLLALVLLVSGSLPASASSFSGTHSTGQHVKLAPTGNLMYHGGHVMVGTVTTYAIFWEPSGTYVSPTYNSLILQYFNDVGSSPLYHNLTQYYNAHSKQPVTSVLGGSWLDTQAYPTTGNKLQEVDIQHEVTLAMQTNGWTPSTHKIFFVFTAKGEILCTDVNSYGCSFGTYSLCAWHNYMGSNTIYAAMPYAGTNLSLCGVPSSPNHDVDADSEINLNSHEQMEAATDPYYTAWYGSDNYHDEIGDKCVWVFGKLNKRGGDVVWHNHPYEVQEEWDNTTSSCVLAGP